MKRIDPAIADTLRDEVRKSGKRLRQIAREADVGFWKFYRWFRGTNELGVADAEKVYHLLTGKTFSGGKTK